MVGDGGVCFHIRSLGGEGREIGEGEGEGERRRRGGGAVSESVSE